MVALSQRAGTIELENVFGVERLRPLRLLVALILFILPHHTLANGSNCSKGWQITGYFTPVQADFAKNDLQTVTIEETSEHQSLPAKFLKQVKLEGWGKTEAGWYLGYYNGSFHRSDAALNIKGKPLSLTSIATDAKVLPYGSNVSIPSLPQPFSSRTFLADDAGNAVTGKHIDIYTGEGKQAEKETFAVTKSDVTVCAGTSVFSDFEHEAPPTTDTESGLPSELEPEARRFAHWLKPRLKSVRYLESGQCETVEYPEWTGYPTTKCTYEISDKRGKRIGTVVLLDPDANRLARWIIFACHVAGNGMSIRSCERKLWNIINDASNAQFPVAGVVYEDIAPADGKWEAYCFRDGITVDLDPRARCNTAEGADPDQDALRVNLALDSAIPPKVAKIYGRIQNTSRQDYLAAGGRLPVEGLAWLAAVKAEYESAWTSDKNVLVIARLRSATATLGKRIVLKQPTKLGATVGPTAEKSGAIRH